MDLGRTIRNSRRRLGLSQTQLATQAGVGLATVQNIERNRSNPALNTLKALFDVLKIRMTIEARPVETDWGVLADLGCPVTTKVDSQVTPTRAVLIEQLNHFGVATLKGREHKAVAAWLHALRDHYPSVWQQLPYSLRAWAQNCSEQPKLRRIALDRLGAYL